MSKNKYRRVHFVYIVRCADGTLYTGYARDPRARERAHNSGRGAKYTAGRRPVRLVYQEAFRSVRKTLAREYVVKQLTRAQKDALVVNCAGGGRSSDGQYARWKPTDSTGRHQKVIRSVHGSTTLVKAAYLSIVIAVARSRWPFPSGVSGSDD
jgi:putative endonuclease